MSWDKIYVPVILFRTQQLGFLVSEWVINNKCFVLSAVFLEHLTF